MGLMTAAALRPAKPVPIPAPMEARKQMKTVYKIIKTPLKTAGILASKDQKVNNNFAGMRGKIKSRCESNGFFVL